MSYGAGSYAESPYAGGATEAAATFIEISPLGVPSAEAVGAPSVQTVQEISPLGTPSAEAVGLPILQTVVELSPLGIPSAEAFGLPAVGDAGTAIHRIKVNGAWVNISRG